MARQRWRAILIWALVGTAIAVGLTLANLASTYDTLGGLVVAGPNDPAATYIARDMPGYPILDAGRHDGQQFYVIARDPVHLSEAAEGLDSPRYRMQRILFPWLAWALHPTGGGEGLVLAMFVVGVVGVFAGSVASGALSVQLRGPPWPAVAFGLMTGTFTALRISTPDPLALALVFWSLWFLLRRRLGWAIVLGIAAVLAKETGLIFLLGFALWRRDRDSVVAVAVPAVIFASWWVGLRMMFPSSNSLTGELIVVPFSGWLESFRFWGQGYEPLGMVSFVAAVVVCVLALVRAGLRHPFGWAILLNVAMFVLLAASAIAPERNAGRTTMGAFMLAIIALATYKRVPNDLRTAGRRDPGDPGDPDRLDDPGDTGSAGWSRGLRLRR